MSVNMNLGSGIGNLGAGRAVSGGCGSIFGVFFGLALVPLALFLVYYGEMKLVNHGVVFAKTAQVTADVAAKSTGLVKFKGKPVGECLRVERYDKPVLYWRTDIEEYREERDSDGDLEKKWVTIGGEKHWAPFAVGPVKITAEKANAVGEKTVFEGIKKRLSTDFAPELKGTSPAVGDQKLTLEVIGPDQDIVVLGEVIGGACSGGTSFVISALDEAGTEQALRTEYKIMYWVIKGGAVMAMCFGLLAIFGPLMNIVGWIPFLGSRLTGALAAGAFFFSLVVVGLVTVAVKFFWIILAVVGLLIVFFIWRGFASPRQKPVSVVP